MSNNSNENTSQKLVGRPSDYDPKYVEQMIRYFGKYLLTLDSEFDENGKAWKKSDKLFPSLAGFAIKLNVCRSTLHEWSVAKNEDGSLKYPEFSYAYEAAKDFQENFLLTGGLNGDVHHSFAQFVMTNILNYRNKPKDEIDTQINFVKDNLTDEQIDSRIEEKLKALGEKK